MVEDSKNTGGGPDISLEFQACIHLLESLLRRGRESTTASEWRKEPLASVTVAPDRASKSLVKSIRQR